jgi:hypothetical protein
MKKLAIFLMVLILSTLAYAQNMNAAFDWIKAGATSSKAKQVETLTSITTVTDTSAIFWFNDLVPYGGIYLKHTKKGAGTLLKTPNIYYVYVDQDSKRYGTDTANTWITLACSSATALAVTTLDTVCRVISYDFRTKGPAGVIFRVAQPTADSCITKVSITGVKSKKDYLFPPIW